MPSSEAGMESSGFQMTPLILLTAAHTAFFLGRLPSMSAAFLRSYLMTLECPQFQLPFIQCLLRVSGHTLPGLTNFLESWCNPPRPSDSGTIMFAKPGPCGWGSWLYWQFKM